MIITLGFKNLKVGDILYRAIAHHYDEEIKIVYETWRIEKFTPQGAWLVEANPPFYSKPQRTWRSSTRFASPTKEEALQRLKYRTIKRYRIALARLATAERVMDYLGIDRSQKKEITYRVVL